MAWSSRITKVFPDIVTAVPVHQPLQMVWQYYDLYYFGSSRAQNFTISLDPPPTESGYRLGYAIAYIGRGSPTSSQDGIPDSADYVLSTISGGVSEITFQVALNTTYWIWIRPGGEPADLNSGVQLAIKSSESSPTTEPYFIARNSGDDGIQVILNDPDGIVTGGYQIYINSDVHQYNRDGSWYIWNLANGYYVVRVKYNLDGTWYSMLNQNSQHATTIQITGGGGGTDPIFTANGSNTDSTITVTVSDLQDTDYDYLYFWVSSSIDSSYTNINPYIFYNVPDGTYDVYAYYVKDNIEHPIYNAYGNRYITIIIDSGGGPTPSGDWNYGSPIYLSNLTENYTSSSAYSFKYDNGALFVITFANSGYARFYSSNEYGDMVAFLGDTNSGFNDTNGIPIDYDRSSRLQNGFNIDFYSVTAGTPYYLWVTAGGAEKTNWGTFYLNIVVPTAPIVYPTYTYSVNNNQVTFNVQNRGNYYLSYIARLASDSSDRTYTLYYTTNTQVTTTELLWNTTYLINVGYSETINGNIEWIGSNQVTIGTNPQSGYVYIYDGSNWRKAKPYIYDGSRWRSATAYIYDGSRWKKTTG